MKLHPAQRAALIVAGVTSVPILWFIVRYTDPFSMAPWAEVRAVWEYALWIDVDVGDGNGLVRWSARIWALAVVVVLLYQQISAAAMRTWGWIRSGS